MSDEREDAIDLWREALLPILVALGLLAIAVGLIEGPPIQDFLYAVF